jgi:hypothetical protein
VNAFGDDAVPLAVCKLTVAGPGGPPGVTAVMVFALTTVTFDANELPTRTHWVPVRLTPVIVIVVPPFREPTLGATDEMIGDVDW